MTDFKEKCEAIGDLLHDTEALISTLVVTIGAFALIAFNRVNAQNSALLQTLAGGGLVYGTSNVGRRMLDRLRDQNQTNVTARQADVVVNTNESAHHQDYQYNPPSVEPLDLPRTYVKPTPADLNDDIGIDLPGRPRRDPTNQRQSKFLGE